MTRTRIDFDFDTAFIDNVIAFWEHKSNSMSTILEHPFFSKLLHHTEEYRNEQLSPEDYLNELLHIDGIDMRRYQKEIVRNLEYIMSVDFENLLNDVHEYLSDEQWSLLKKVVIFPVIGVAGMNMDNAVIIDPSPCPWFPCDGSDKERYLQEFVLPTLRHEVHHLAFYGTFPSKDMKSLTDWQLLSEDMAIQIVAEGAAMLCEKKTDYYAVSDSEREMLKGFLSHFHDLCVSKNHKEGLNDGDWHYYYSLWEEQLVYNVGYSLIMYLLSEMNMSIKECMSIEPIMLLGLVHDRLLSI